MADQTIVCCDCETSFVFNEGEQAFYAGKNLTPPRRCKDCRAKRKAKRNNGQQNNDPINIPGVHEEDFAGNGAADML